MDIDNMDLRRDNLQSLTLYKQTNYEFSIRCVLRSWGASLATGNSCIPTTT